MQQRGDAPRSRHSIREDQGAPGVRRQNVVQQLIALLITTVQRGLFNLASEFHLYSSVPDAAATESTVPPVLEAFKGCLSCLRCLVKLLQTFPKLFL